jgi:hypothetical protein
MTQAQEVAITWNPEPPLNRKRWEAEIKNVLGSPSGAVDVNLVQDGHCWRVQTAMVVDGSVGSVEMRHAVTDYLRAMGFPVSS